MEHPTSQPATEPTPTEQDRAFAAFSASIERLDELGLHDDQGRVVVEPATAFHAS